MFRITISDYYIICSDFFTLMVYINGLQKYFGKKHTHQSTIHYKHTNQCTIHYKYTHQCTIHYKHTHQCTIHYKHTHQCTIHYKHILINVLYTINISSII